MLPCCRWIRLRTGWERIAGEVDLRRLLEHDQTLKQMRADIVVTHADGMSVCLRPRFPSLAIPRSALAMTTSSLLFVERTASAASGPMRDACLDAATSDAAESSAASAIACMPQRGRRRSHP